MSESDNGSLSENGIVTVADYISRAESQSRQQNPQDLKKNKKERGPVEDIAEHASSATMSNGPAKDRQEPEKRAPDVSTERDPKVHYHEDGNQAAVLNGIS
ncbi:hypothetical protein GJAV_G00072510 [Gymnothorax javanicus]|nr:hypothetical protein GJAV_G00072510 [Gymnothorax javanicus]